MARAPRSITGYTRWGNGGVWKGIFDALAKLCEDSLIFIDSSIVKAHRAEAGSKKGNWKKESEAHARVAQVRFTLLLALAPSFCYLPFSLGG